MPMRVADYIARHLNSVGVKTVFMLSGGGMMHLVDAVGRVPGLRYVCNHHEQASAMAADAYARQSGSLGVCYATSGPGATNILTGLVGAWQDSSPVLFLTGQSKVSQTIRGSGIEGLRQFGAFEADIVPIVQSVTKYAVFLDDPKQARYHLEKAIHLALTGRPGPVLIDVPLDVQGAPIDPETLPAYEPQAPDMGTVDEAALREVLCAIDTAERPLVLAGYGVRCAQAVDAFRSWVARSGLPVITTQLAKDVLPYDDPLFTGHPGVKGDRPGNFAVQRADLLLCLGCSLNAMTTGYELDAFAPRAHKIMIDPDPAVLRKEDVNVAQKIRCDIASFLAGALANTAPQDAERFAAWRRQCLEWKARYAVRNEPHDLSDGPVNFYEFADVLSDALAGSETIVTDAGSAFYVMGQAFKAKRDQRYIVSGSLGAMGFSLPASIGAAVADPARMAVCVTGDGSLQTNIQELQTVRHNGLNLKLFIISNDGYASIRNTQAGFFDGFYVGCSRDSGVSIPPLDKLADTYGIPFVACEHRGRLAESIRETLDRPGPVMCSITAQPGQQIIPTVTSVRLPNGAMKSADLDAMFPFVDRGTDE